MKQSLRLFPFIALTLLLSGCAAFVEYGSESSLGIGARGNVPLGRVLSPEGSVGGATVSRLELAGSLHRSWPKNGTYTEGNVDLVLPLTSLGGGAARSYLGGGLHVGRVSPEVGEDRTELGVNVLAGVRFDRRVAAPFFEVRGALGGYDQFSAAVGLQLFGGMF